MKPARFLSALPAVLAASVLANALLAADDKKQDEAPAAEVKKNRLVKLAKDYDIWVDMKRKQVLVDGVIAVNDGTLEMFACPRRTKEHESIIAVNSTARFVHAGLLAVGAKAGHPVRYDPEYLPAKGSKIEITVHWTDAEGKEHTARAQEWVRDVKTRKELKHDWVFGGSSFWTDEASGERHYSGDAGELVCVSNFTTATLDLPINSSESNDALLFEAYTERIPPRGTKVRLVFAPQPEKKDTPKDKSDASPKKAADKPADDTPAT